MRPAPEGILENFFWTSETLWNGLCLIDMDVGIQNKKCVAREAAFPIPLPQDSDKVPVGAC